MSTSRWLSTVPLLLLLPALVARPAGAQDKRPPAAAETRALDKASPGLMTGKVIRVDDKARTFTVASKGREVTFHAGKIPSLPKVGAVVDVTYTGSGGGPLEAANLNLSKSNID